MSSTKKKSLLKKQNVNYYLDALNGCIVGLRRDEDSGKIKVVGLDDLGCKVETSSPLLHNV